MDFQNQTQNQMPYNMPNNLPNNRNLPYPLPPIREKENSMATAAMVTGIIAGISTILLSVYLPCIFAGVSIVLALLSKGSRNKLSPHALTGMVISFCSLALNLVIIIGSFYLVFTVPEFREEFDQMYEQMYGESFDDMMEDTFGTDF